MGYYDSIFAQVVDIVESGIFIVVVWTKEELHVSYKATRPDSRMKRWKSNLLLPVISPFRFSSVLPFLTFDTSVRNPL